MMLTFEDSTQPVQRKIKMLVYGGPKVGKTWFSVHAPAPLVFDTESSTDAYRGRPDFPPFKVAKTASARDLLPVLDELQAKGYIQAGKERLSPETVIIDSFSVLWQVRQEAGQKIAEKRAAEKKRSEETARIAFGDWSLIKRPIHNLYTQLINMPVHVIVTAREKALYDDNADQPKVIGQAPDIERNATYVFDLILRLAVESGKRTGYVEGSRFAEFPPGTRIENPSWQTFAHLASVEGAESKLPDIEQSAETEANDELASQPAEWTKDTKIKQAAEKWLHEDVGLTDAEADKALGHPWRTTHLSRDAFKEAVTNYVAEQASGMPLAKPASGTDDLDLDATAAELGGEVASQDPLFQAGHRAESD